MALSTTLENPKVTEDAGAKRLYACSCGQAIFFGNSRCMACESPLGYDAETATVYPLHAAPAKGQWFAHAADAPARAYVRCANLDSPAGCNWLIPVAAEGKTPTLCTSCRLNRTIPDLSVAGNAENWRRIEKAKRRLVSSLLRLKLPVASRVGEDPERGLAFDFLKNLPDSPPVLTGHSDGIITINIDEAEDVKREQVRVQMNEPYRTILGHLRHESGHYYWDRIVKDTEQIEAFRKLFGDERQDYAQALARHYKDGAPAGWPQEFVSAYATSHPWEDWAESWAHYLHMTDTLDTAGSFHLRLGRSPVSVDTFNEEALCDAERDSDFLSLINRWIPLTSALNELSLSMGLADFYPFVLSPGAVRKLHFVHLAIQGRLPLGSPVAAEA